MTTFTIPDSTTIRTLVRGSIFFKRFMPPNEVILA